MPTDADALKVKRVEWRLFKSYLRRRIKAGDHAVVIGSTGSGKSWLAREVVPMFGRNIVVLDGKGGDDPSLDFPGFKTIKAWPPALEGNLTRAFGFERRPIHLRLAPPMRTIGDLPRAKGIFKTTLEDLFTRRPGNRTRPVYALYVDEMQIVADPREGMGLGRYIGPLLRTKRYHGMSIITATQYPTWIPKSSYRESTHRFLFKIGDEESLDQLGRIAGNRRKLVPVLNKLRKHEFLYIHREGQAYISKVVR